MTPCMISLLIAIACLPWVKAQFPKVCVNLESLKNKTYCPKPNGYHEPCGSDGNRGEFAGGTVLTVITKSSTGRTSTTTDPWHSSTELASASQTLPDMIVASVSTVTMVTTANRKEP